MVSDSALDDVYDPSYRQQDVDDTLSNHEGRITRLEKVVLIGAGYILGTASLSATEIVSIFI